MKNDGYKNNIYSLSVTQNALLFSGALAKTIEFSSFAVILAENRLLKT